MAEFHRILQQYWGYTSFRGIQLDIIQSIAAGHDTLGLMPTGGGKSITFQVPALAKEGLCLIVTPLIALMRDQVDNLEKRNIRATAIFAGLTAYETNKRLDNAIFGAYKFLYISPERLASPLFMKKASRMNISFITVDEAHCISQWGYDFRPHYLKIAEFRKLVPNAPVLALTATATPPVVKDIQQKLAFREPFVFRMSFERKNLRYIVRETENKEEEMLHIINHVPGCAIVYARSRKAVEEISIRLVRNGITASYYHAGLSSVEKDLRQELWKEGKARVIVATNAFGMGIDKSDVRLVLHYEAPDSLEAYYQEAGRAGRDGQPAYAVLLYNQQDGVQMRRRVKEKFPSREYIANVYEKLAYFFSQAIDSGEGITYEFDIHKFCRTFKFFPTGVENALELLMQAGYINYKTEDEASSRIYFLVTRDFLYRMGTLTFNEETVLDCLLRTYCGVFTDFVSIEEDFIAESCHIGKKAAYEALKQLARRRIIQYVPKKHTPHITYLTNRVDEHKLVIPKAIYDDRLKHYLDLTECVLNYIENNQVCRSCYLLNYFADNKGTECGGCDICLGKKNRAKEFSKKMDECEAAVRTLLANGHPCGIKQMRSAYYDHEILSMVLRNLIDAGEIVQKYNNWQLAK